MHSKCHRTGLSPARPHPHPPTSTATVCDGCLSAPCICHTPRPIGPPCITQLHQAAKSLPSLMHRLADSIDRHTPDALVRDVDRLSLATTVTTDVYGGRTRKAECIATDLFTLLPRLHPGDRTTRGEYAVKVRQRAAEVSC